MTSTATTRVASTSLRTSWQHPAPRTNLGEAGCKGRICWPLLCCLLHWPAGSCPQAQ
jgi:hypothetical protein